MALADDKLMMRKQYVSYFFLDCLMFVTTLIPGWNFKTFPTAVFYNRTEVWSKKAHRYPRSDHKSVLASAGSISNLVSKVNKVPITNQSSRRWSVL